MRMFDDVMVACDHLMLQEAEAVRAVLESFALRVHFYRLYQKYDVLDFFAGKGVPECDYTVLVCHGTGRTEGEAAIALDVGEQEDDDPRAPTGWEPMEFLLTPKNIPEVVTGARGTLVSIACGSGRRPLAGAFLKAGYSSYVAPIDGYDGDAVLLFVTGFFYHLLAEDRDLCERSYSEEEAVERAAAMDREFEHGTRVFRHYAG